MLQFNAAWRFESPGRLPRGAVQAIAAVIARVAGQTSTKATLEHFKTFFASAGGFVSNYSSDVSWAQSDLNSYMDGAAENAPLFIEAFYDACQALAERNPELALPDLAFLNRLLAQHDAGFEIRPPHLVATRGLDPVAVAAPSLSLDAQAQDLIQKSLRQSELLLSEGRPRQAVQESLWLLETVSTAFQGLAIAETTIQGKYFNKIADELRRHGKGTTLAQVLGWVTTLHGYLSSPTGGGVRHGADLRLGVAVDEVEARLYCNLIRSYISYLLAEYDRLNCP